MCDVLDCRFGLLGLFDVAVERERMRDILGHFVTWE
jgi:hypothetical protein